MFLVMKMLQDRGIIPKERDSELDPKNMQPCDLIPLLEQLLSDPKRQHLLAKPLEDLEKRLLVRGLITST